MKRLEDKKEGDIVEVFKWFKSHVIDYKLEPSIEHQELVSNWEYQFTRKFIYFRPCLLFFQPIKICCM